MTDSFPRERTPWRRPAAVVAAALFALAACEQKFPAPPSRDFRVRNVEREHIVDFAPGSSSPTARAQADLRAFLLSQDLSRAKKIVIGGGFPLTQQRRAEVEEIVGEFRGPEVSFAGPEGISGGVSVVVHREVFHPAACLDGAPPSAGWLPPGCANEYNLTRQIERPGDLKRGRTPGPSPAARAVDVYRRYMREAVPAENEAGGGAN